MRYGVGEIYLNREWVNKPLRIYAFITPLSPLYTSPHLIYAWPYQLLIDSTIHAMHAIYMASRLSRPNMVFKSGRISQSTLHPQ